MSFVAAVLLALTLLAPGLAAQQPTLPPAAELQSALAAAQNDPQLDDATRSRVVSAYTEALALLPQIEAQRKTAAEFDDSRTGAPKKLQELRAELAKPVPTPHPDVEGTPLSALEQQLAIARASLETAIADADALAREADERAARRRALPGLIAAARTAVQQAEAPPAAPSDDPEGNARAALATVQHAVTAADLAALESELASYEARGDLLLARRDVATRRRADAEAAVKVWQDAVDARRQADARAAEAKARAALDADHPLLREIAQKNAALAQRRSELAAAISQATHDEQQVRDQLAALDAAFRDVERRIDIAGLTEAIGLQLRRLRNQLPDLRHSDRAAAERRQHIAEIGIEALELQEERAHLADVNHLAAERAAGASADVERRATELLTEQRDNLDVLVKDADRLFDALVALDTRARALVAKARDLRTFIDEHVLWVPSGVPLWRTTLPTAREVHGLMAGDAWGTLPSRLLQPDRLLLLAFGIGLAVWLFVTRKRRRQALVDTATQASRTTKLQPTWSALVSTVLLAAPGPLLLLAAAVAIGFDSDIADDPVPALAKGLLAAGLLLLTAELLRQMVRRGGLSEGHFAWRPAVIVLLRRALPRLAAVLVPVAVVIAVLDHDGEEDWRSAASRVAFVAAMVALSMFFLRVLHPRRGLLAPAAGAHPRDFFTRSRWLWLLLAAGAPLALAVLAVLGYSFTARALAARLTATLGLVLGTVIVHDVMVRGLLLSRRRLAMQQAAARAAARQARAETGEEPLPIPEPAMDPNVVSAQARQLVRSLVGVTIVVGSWLIWVDVLPALGVLREVHLWADTSAVTQTTVDAQGHVQTDTQHLHWITLADLVFSGLLLFLTALAARGLPSFLSLTLLRRLHVHEGERHAIATMTRYVIVAVGVIAAFSAIGIGWSKVQWMAAALGIGLGFGLQEIFANFVSGIVILFERPIRVGDVVTVGDVDGKVARIRIRATTIVDWDRRELLIPNRDLITGKVINWTLTDPVTRLVVPVGVAYGTDLEKARAVLLEAARTNPLVLQDPEPSAIVHRFADSAVQFDLRVYFASRDQWPELIDSLHVTIHDRFQREGIEIAFPQIDVHVRQPEVTPGPAEGPVKKPTLSPVR